MLPELAADLSEQIEEVIAAHTEAASRRVDLNIDDEFYAAAAKASLPKRAWKSDFATKLEELEGQLVDRTKFEKDIERVSAQFGTRVQERLIPALNEIKVRSIDLSGTARTSLAELNKKQPRRDRFFRGRKELRNILEIRLGRDSLIAAGLVSLGLGSWIAAKRIGTETVGTIGAEAVAETVGPAITEEAGSIVSDWLLENFGSEVVATFLETCAAALTVVGIGFAIYRGYRYYDIYQRLFIEKEPLQRMRADTKASVRRSLAGVGASIEKHLREEVEDWLFEIEGRLRRVSKEAEEQELWIVSRVRSRGAA